MSDTRYPTRMHELLGVELGEEATYKSGSIKIDFFVDECGLPRCDNNRILYGHELARIINHPERITRRPRLTEEQLYALEATVKVFGYKWLAVDSTGIVWVFTHKPKKASRIWTISLGEAMRVRGHERYLASLVSWSDPAPLDIVQTLRDAGRLEVE